MATAPLQALFDLAAHALETGDTDAAIATLVASVSQAPRATAGPARIMLTEATSCTGTS